MSKLFRGLTVIAFFMGLFLLVGCESSSSDEGYVDLATLEGQAPADNTTENNDNGGGGDSGGGTAGDIPAGTQWLYQNVSGWAVTASLTVTFSGSNINLNYDKAKVWPGVSGANANPWVFVNYGGTWYAATWEYLRPGQTSKPKAVVEGSHIKVAPLTSWRPSSGEQLGFMVSGLVRGGLKNVSERSNIYWTTWP